MSYKILGISQDGETIITEVEYTIEKEVITVQISHFAPQTKEEVLEGISNREATESVKLTQAEKNKQIIAELAASVGVSADEVIIP